MADRKSENALTTTSKTLEEHLSCSRDSDVQKLLLVTAEAMQVELPSQAALLAYHDDLKDLGVGEIAQALSICRKELRTYGKFPTSQQIVDAVRGSKEAAACLAFQTAANIAAKHCSSKEEGRVVLGPASGPVKAYYSDDGEVIYSAKNIPVPPIPAEMDYAVRLCGGWGALFRLVAQERDLDGDTAFAFYRKAFVAAFLNYDANKLVEFHRPELAGKVGEQVKQLAEAKKL